MTEKLFTWTLSIKNKTKKICKIAFSCIYQIAEIKTDAKLVLSSLVCFLYHSVLSSDPLDPHCSDWEVFNGVDCVCADDVSARCTGQGGMVCDNTGSQYKSACAFALDTCSEKIPQDRTIETCGKQEHMSLVVRKPVFGVSDQVRHKPACAVTEDG